MAKIENFEDIEAWQKARELTKQIYALSNDGQFRALPKYARWQLKAIG